MSDNSFRAFVVEETEPKQFTRSVQTRTIDDLPEGDVLVRVQYSSLNYKDGLSATGAPGVTRNYPHTPGVDAAGTVVSSSDSAFEEGDAVVVIGYDLGMNTAGGYGEFIRVPANWVVKLPNTLTAREAMIYGTAGFTAVMCVDRLVSHGIKPEDGEILVTGATGGVGSFAVALLAKLGYTVVAATGKVESAQGFLTGLGATSLISRAEATDDSKRPLLRERWAGVVDTVGGDMLVSALKAVKRETAVAICGLVASPKLSTTVFPFILRGITLYGVDSVEINIEEKQRIWTLLAGNWKLEGLETFVKEVTIDDLEPEILLIMNGKQVGRILVNLT
ncbi:MAG: YhdH/YhfP family quinone oxidoreductase [Chloroflexota bacterium]